MLKVAIIGTGGIAPSHIKGYLTFKDQCEIVALCDIYPEKSEEMAKNYHLAAEVFDDHKKLLERDDIDLVSVCTPPYTHAEISINALHAGKHVIVEKPMASSLEECDEMNSAAKKTGNLLSVIAQNRFRTSFMKLKALLGTGLTGPIVHTQVDSFWWRGHSYYDLWWRGTWEKEGGGCTLNHAVHHIDIFQWMNGMPNEITAVTSNAAHDNAEVEDISVAVGKYDNGSLAQITSSVIHHGEEQQLIFQGKNARISAPWKVSASKSMENGFPEKDPELEKEIQNTYDELPGVEHEGHTGQIHNVLGALSGQNELLIDGLQGRKTLELITAIYQSASQKETVRLPLTEKSPFYTRAGILKNTKHFYEKTTSIENFHENKITTGSDDQ